MQATAIKLTDIRCAEKSIRQ